MSESVRSSVRVECPAVFQQVSSYRQGRTANDSVENLRLQRPRVTARRVAEVATSLTDLDRHIVASVARLRVVSGHQLQRLHFRDRPSAARQARRTLHRLVELGVLARLGRRIGGVRAGSAGFVYALDVLGQRLTSTSGRPRRPWTPGLPFLTHSLAVSEVYVRLMERTCSGWVTQFDTEPQSWRTFIAAGGARLTLKPDAFLIVSAHDYEDRWFIEVDCGTEGPSAVTRKLKTYEDYWRHGREQVSTGVFPKVLWLAPTLERVAVLQTLINARTAEVQHLFAVARFEAVVSTIKRGPS